jgi:Domain of unknown function (DUF4440)
VSDKEIIDLEKSYWQSIKDKNSAAATRLTADPCIVTGAQGAASIPSSAMKGMLEGAAWTLGNFELKDIIVQRPTSDVAIIAYKISEELLVDGKPLKLEAADASTWIRRDGRWQCALHTESISGDPFGRDRKR